MLTEREPQEVVLGSSLLQQDPGVRSPGRAHAARFILKALAVHTDERKEKHIKRFTPATHQVNGGAGMGSCRNLL